MFLGFFEAYTHAMRGEMERCNKRTRQLSPPIQQQVQFLVPIEYVDKVGRILLTTSEHLPLYEPILVPIVEEIWL
jgi:hypothetical protein